MQLREYLAAKQITVPAFAEKIGVTVQAIHRYMDGDRMPRLELLRKIRTETDGKVRADDFEDAAITRQKEIAEAKARAEAEAQAA